MIELPNRDDALCFNINDKPGTIFNLVRDPQSGKNKVLKVLTMKLHYHYEKSLKIQSLLFRICGQWPDHRKEGGW